MADPEGWDESPCTGRVEFFQNWILFVILSVNRLIIFVIDHISKWREGMEGRMKGEEEKGREGKRKGKKGREKHPQP